MAERREERGVPERILEPWFAALRAEPPQPPLALLSAILGDAARVNAERRAAVAPGPERAAAEGRRALDGIGGWKGLAALAACAALGFWIGISGEVTIEDGEVWSAPRSVAADTAPEDPVGAFFDLASVGG